MADTRKQELVSEIISVIVDAVNLHHLPRASISADTSLRQGGLELDSVDLLEIVVAIEHRFGVKVKDAETGKTHFRTIGSIADFVSATGSAAVH